VEKCWKVIMNDEAKGRSHALLEGLTESVHHLDRGIK